MSSPAPNHNEPDSIAAALRRDAERVPEPPFDPALHYATLRRIRSLSRSEAAPWEGWWRPALAVAAILVVAAICPGLRSPPNARETAQRAAPAHLPDFAPVLASTQAAVASLSRSDWAPLPAWTSPTAALLDSPYLPSINPAHPL